ncbi:MAG: hypothetical protein JW967_08015 [Dehalococcoidales bacterium]|nr:hypothetical protein [Dehalococcoidales bacterium]
MKNAKKLLIITLALVSLIFPLSLFGCQGSESTITSTTTSTAATTTETTPIASTTDVPPINTSAITSSLTPGQLLAAEAVEASASVKTFKMNMDMTMLTEVTGGENPGVINMSMSSQIEMDQQEKLMKMVLDIVMDIPDMGEQTVSTASYLDGEWMYTMVNIPGFGDQWMKMRFDEATWEEQDQFSQQVEFLETAFGVTEKGTETVGGLLCDVIEIQPDMATLEKWVMAQQSDESMSQLAGVDLSEVFKTFTIKYWIARDSSLPVKFYMDVVMEMTPEDMGESSDEFEKMTMEMTTTVLFFDYGEPVEIILPPEAANAQEIPN